ncbi:hypothetical protein LUZ60_007664 [Juncus effusus]|nr:hypothetical protein LUZ60_007664 [Juncus effusus]
MVHGVNILSRIVSFLVKLFQEIKKAFMALLCAPESHAHLPVTCKRHCTDMSEAGSGKVKIPNESWKMESSKVHPACMIGDTNCDNLKSTEGKTESKENNNGHVILDVDKKAGLGFNMNKKRPAKLFIPDNFAGPMVFCEKKMEDCLEKELKEEGDGFCLFGKKGPRHAMEDGYGVINEKNGNSKMSFFGVYDGHGGQAAVEHISNKLGKNVINKISQIEKGELNQIEMAIRAGYLTTDEEFLTQHKRGGACAATAVIIDGELYVANVGDCRVVLSQNGVAIALTQDHSASREDERDRIELSGGYVSAHTGVWRVQDSLAVSRAFGDLSQKKWVICKPDMNKLQLTHETNFLVLASDGLWEKVTNQEAVDVVVKNNISMQTCKELVELSRSRGSRDDITVMLIDLQKFVQLS